MNMLDWLLMVLKQVMLNPLSIPVVMLSMLYYREVSMAGFRNKITAFAGESATGKTFFVLGIVKQFLSDNPDGGVLYFESESAITKDMIEKRVLILLVWSCYQLHQYKNFAHQSTKILDKYLADQERKPMMICLDSLGMLSTSKELTDIADGKETKDMTRAALVKVHLEY